MALDYSSSDQAMPQAPARDVQVAGLGKGILQAVQQSRTARLERATIDPDAAVQTHAGTILIKPASENDLAQFQIVVPKVDGKPGNQKINYFQINLDQLTASFGGDASEFVSRIVEINKVAIDAAKRSSMTLDEIKAGADKIGLTEMTARLLNRKQGKALENAEEMYRALVVQVSSLMTARHAWLDFQKIKSTGSPEEVDAAAHNFLVAMTLQGTITTSLIGAKAETARMMSVLSNFGKIADANTGPSLSEIEGLVGQNVDAILKGNQAIPIVEAMGGVDAIEIMGRKYMTMLPHQQVELNKSAWRWVGKGMDVFIESFLNNILSGPTTHVVNMAATAANMIYQLPVNVVAAGIGRATGSADAMSIQESLIGPVAWIHSFREGLDAARLAWKTENPADLTSKLDVRNRRAISAENFELDPENPFGKSVEALGRFVRIPGRFLVAEDEFFKAMSYREEIYKQAIRRGLEVRKAGGTKKEVQDTISNSILNPDKAAAEAAAAYAQKMTFQTPMQGKWMKLAGDFASHPVAKIFVPFFVTPTNIFQTIGENSPIALMMPRFWKAMDQGGKEAHNAIARLTFGSTIMATFGYLSMGGFGDEFVITGYGPTDPKARQHWLDQGFRSYSFAFKNDDGTYRSKSYSRFDPVSGMLAMATDAAWHLRHNPDVTELPIVATVAMWKYLQELPMMQGVLNMTDLLGAGKYAEPEKRVNLIMQGIMEQVGKAASTAVPGLIGPLSPTGSFAKTLKRYFDPVKRGKMLPQDMPSELRYHPAWGGLFKQFYKTLQEARGRSPYFSKGILPETDRWGFTKYESHGQIHEMINPIKSSDTRINRVETYLNKLELGLNKPSNRIGNIELSQEQYNRLKEIANSSTNVMTGADGQQVEVNLLGALNLQIDILNKQENQGEFLLPGDKIRRLRHVDSKFFEQARNILLMEYPDLDNAIKERDAIIDVTGKPP